jgi:hypothetical protein
MIQFIKNHSEAILIVSAFIVFVALISSCSANKRNLHSCNSYDHSLVVKPNKNIGQYQGTIVLKKNRKKSI